MNELQFSILIFLLLGTTFLIGEIYRRRFISRAKKTRGTIIEMETKSGGDGNTTLVTVEYTTDKGRIYEYTYYLAYPLFFKRAGSHINVYYDPKKPSENVVIGNPIISFNMVFGLLILGYSIYRLIKYFG